MKVWTELDKTKLEDIANGIGLRLTNFRVDGRAWAFTLKTKGAKPRYRRLSQRVVNKDGSRRTVPGAVCWHGHRDFYRAVYVHDEDARIKTTMADYKGSRDFERKYPSTRSAGGGYYGFEIVPYHQACICDDFTTGG